MAWEGRARGGWYYTRSRRESGRIVREYVGTGLIGEVAALSDAVERTDREKEAAARRCEQQQLLDEEAAVIALCASTDHIVQEAFERAGFRRHKRGEWRRRRDGNTGPDGHERADRTDGRDAAEGDEAGRQGR